MLKRPSDGFWAGLVVGILIVTVLMAFHVDVNGSDNSAAPPAVVTSTKDAEAFVAAWNKMVSGSWTVESTYTRTLDGGSGISSSVKDVQSPPDYLDIASAVISGSIGGRQYVCASADKGLVSGCRDNGASPPYQAYAQNRVVAVQSVVIGSQATYSVQAQPGDCYEVFLNPGQTANNWGNRARFCFDQKTGAPIFTGLYKDGGSDVTAAARVAAPTPDDLKITKAN